MIRSFRDPDAERLFQRQRVRRLPPDLHRIALRKLIMLDANRLEKLTGDRSGQYSIRVNDQWRICFRWVGSDAHDVEIVDYH